MLQAQEFFQDLAIAAMFGLRFTSTALRPMSWLGTEDAILISIFYMTPGSPHCRSGIRYVTPVLSCLAVSFDFSLMQFGINIRPCTARDI